MCSWMKLVSCCTTAVLQVYSCLTLPSQLGTAGSLQLHCGARACLSNAKLPHKGAKWAKLLSFGAKLHQRGRVQGCLTEL